jgi:ABC-type multidrug transport system fused ATPase/permease subunit
MRPYARQVAGLLGIGSLCGVLMNTAVVLPAVLLGHAVDVVLAHDRGGADDAALTRAALLLVAGTLATELPRIGKRYWLGVARNRIRANVRADAIRGVLSWPADRLHRTSAGEVIGRAHVQASHPVVEHLHRHHSPRRHFRRRPEVPLTGDRPTCPYQQSSAPEDPAPYT